MELVLPNAKILKSCIDAITTLIDEGEFQFAADGVRLRAMDPSQIAMVDFFMPKNAFDKYSTSVEKLGVNLEDFAALMGRTRPEDELTLKLDETKTRLNLIFKGHSTRRFTVSLIDVRGTTPKEPQIEFQGIAKVNGSHLKESLKDTVLVSSHVVLRMANDAFYIEAMGDKGEANIETKKTDDSISDYVFRSSCKAMFPLEYLNDILKAADSTTPVTVSLRTDAPLKIDYPIGDAHITYYLAPRIETQ